MTEAVLLCSGAIWMWPSAAAEGRLRALGRAGRGRVGDRSAPSPLWPSRARRWLMRLWWVPGSALLLAKPALALAALLAAASARAAWRARRARMRGRERVAALQVALAAVVDELRVGAHPANAFEAAAHEHALSETRGGRQTAQTMREAAARARLGGDVAEGLRARARASRATGPDAGGELWRRLASCWELSQQEGVPVAQVLSSARSDLVERARFRERTDAALAGARSTARILSGLPLLCLLLGQALGARPLQTLLSETGSFLLLLGCAFTCAGVAWSRRITSGRITSGRTKSGGGA